MPGCPAAAAELAADGRRPFLMPRGGASGLGAVGYALAAFEVREQLAAHGVDSARVVVATGSGGTLAGLVAGNVLAGRPLTLVGAAVSRPPDETARRVLGLARECLRVLTGSGLPGVPGVEAGFPGLRSGRMTWWWPTPAGPGHGLASPEGTAAAETGDADGGTDGGSGLHREGAGSGQPVLGGRQTWSSGIPGASWTSSPWPRRQAGDHHVPARGRARRWGRPPRNSSRPGSSWRMPMPRSCITA